MGRAGSEARAGMPRAMRYGPVLYRGPAPHLFAVVIRSHILFINEQAAGKLAVG
jgi:hypothetical protein